MNSVVCMAAQGSDQGLTLPEVAMAHNECLRKADSGMNGWLNIYMYQVCRLSPGISMLLLPY